MLVVLPALSSVIKQHSSLPPLRKGILLVLTAEEETLPPQQQ